MSLKKTIYDEIDLNIDPYKVLKINPNSNNETIKEAYKIMRKSVSLEYRDTIDHAYDLIKTSMLRRRYFILRNRPLNSLDDIKQCGLKAIKTQTKEWIKLIED